MRPDGDYPLEMPDHDLVDDATAEALLGGRSTGRADLGLLAAFVQDVTLLGRVREPAPSPALASVLERGFSTDKGDLLVTAGSNASASVPQTSELPKWRKEREMESSGLASVIFAKLASMGTAAKAAVATSAMTAVALTGGAAAGALPAPVQNAVVGVVSSITPFDLSDGGGDGEHERATGSLTVDAPVPGEVPASAAVQADAGGPATAGAGISPAPAHGGGGSARTTGSVTPTIPSVGSLPVPGLTDLPTGTQLPACVKDLIPAGGSVPDPSALLAQVPACVQTVLASHHVPVEVAACVNSILASLPAAGSVSGVGNLSALDLSACVPVDLTQCATSFMGAMQNLAGASTGFGGLTGLGSLANLGSLSGWTQFGSLAQISGVSGLAGCVPQNVTQCLTSVLGGLAGATPGSVPDLDLSACLPVSPTGSLPGLAELSKLPGFSHLSQFIPKF